MTRYLAASQAPAGQRNRYRRASLPLSALCVCVASAGPGLAVAQEAAADARGQAQGSRPAWVITPSVSVEGTYTDNVNLAADKKSDFITQLSPGLALRGQSSRASANVNYQWLRNIYADTSTRNNDQRSLSANGKLELVDRWLFIEGSQNVSRSAVSAFGTQSANNELINANRTETSAYSISPYIQGRLFGIADYQFRFSGTTARSDAGALSATATRSRSWTGHLAGATPLVPLGWAIDASHQVVSQAAALDTRSHSVNGTLTYQIDPQFRVHLSAGRESDNFTDTVRQQRTTSGIGLDWAPTERTLLALRKDKNAAGNAYSIDFSHRTALSAWKFSDSRSVVVPTPQLAQAPRGTAYDLTNLALTSQFPDPVQRAAATSQLLAQSGIAPNAVIFSPILTSQVYIQKRQQASFSLFGVNNTVVFAFDRSDSQQIGSGNGLADDFSLSSDIRQSGFNTSWSHKLSPDSALTLSAANSRSSGSGNVDSLLKSLSLSLTSRIGAKTSGSLGLRQTRYDAGGAGTSYDEHALTGSLQLTF